MKKCSSSSRTLLSFPRCVWAEKNTKQTNKANKNAQVLKALVHTAGDVSHLVVHLPRRSPQNKRADRVSSHLDGHTHAGERERERE